MSNSFQFMIYIFGLACRSYSHDLTFLPTEEITGTSFYLILLFYTLLQCNTIILIIWNHIIAGQTCKRVLFHCVVLVRAALFFLSSLVDCKVWPRLRSIMIVWIKFWWLLLFCVNLCSKTSSRDGHRFWFLKTSFSAPPTSRRGPTLIYLFGSLCVYDSLLPSVFFFPVFQ